MAIRKRSRSLPDSSGFKYLYTSGGTRTWSKASYDCSDVVGVPGDCHLFRSEIRTAEGGRIDYPLPYPTGPVSGPIFYNYRADRWGDITHVTHVPRATPSDAVYATKLVTMTAPDRPVVDLINFVAELRDLPKQLMFEGRNIVREFSNQYLALQFGWKPLVGDLHKLIHFQEAVDKRFNELKKLRDGGLKRTVILDRFRDSSFTKNDVAQSLFMFLYTNEYKTTERLIKGYARYESGYAPDVSDNQLKRDAFRSAFGVYANFEAVWDSLPWTWLIDWCGNVGDVLSTTRNLIPISKRTLCIMRTTSTTLNAKGYTFVNGSYKGKISDYTSTVVSKERNVATPGLSFNLPVLDSYRISILSSLLEQRSRRGRRSF